MSFLFHLYRYNTYIEKYIAGKGTILYLGCIVVFRYCSHGIQQTRLKLGLSYQHHHMNLEIIYVM